MRLSAVDPNWLGASRTPSLRCAAGRPSYMHTAQLDSLEKAVRFFAQGRHPAGCLGESELTDSNFDEAEIADWVAFISACRLR